MMTSFAMPSVSGKRSIFATSLRVIAAAVASVSAAAAPPVTIAASVPVWRAMAAPARVCSSAMSTKAPAASRMASSVCASIRLPPRRVRSPAPFTRFGTDKRW
jgi:hypothetical protein